MYNPSLLELLEKRVSKRLIAKFVLRLDDRLVLLDVNSVLVVALQHIILIVRKFQHRSVSLTHFAMIPNHPRDVFFSCEEQLTTFCVAFLPHHTSRRVHVLTSMYRDGEEFRCPRCRKPESATTTHVTTDSSSILCDCTVSSSIQTFGEAQNKD